jgi:hypothetical protein
MVMYYDEHYHATGINDFDNDTVNSNDLNKNALETMNKHNKKYVKITRSFNKKWIDGKFYKKIQIDCFKSGRSGNRIVNAVTGEYTTHIVGSVDEDLYFKVSLCTRESGIKEPIHLFYDSPEQYENHHFNIVIIPLKERWYEKNLEAKKTNKLKS